MSNAHTDAQLMLMTQIAYLNISPGQGGHPRNVKDWIDSTYENLKYSTDPADQCQIKTIENIRNMLSNEDYGDLGFENWTVVDGCDHNGGTGSGMYSMLVDTGDGNAVIAFRGSESYNAEQNIKDWAVSDLGLLDNVITPQQADAQEYTRRVLEKYGDKYDSFDTAGHSLGGNLAEHAMITVPEEHRDKMGRAVNFDGPGFSDEYIVTHIAEIKFMAGKVDHYSWSCVGALLFAIPGSNYNVVDAVTPDGNLLQRHGTENVVFRNGSVVPGVRDPLAEGMYYFTKALEFVPVELIKVQLCALVLAGAIGLHVLGMGFKWIVDRFNELFVREVEFTVQPSALAEASQELDALALAEMRISAEAADISNNLTYNSLGGYYCRNKIRNIAGSIGCDSDSARRLGSAITACAADYSRTDKKVADMLNI